MRVILTVILLSLLAGCAANTSPKTPDFTTLANEIWQYRQLQSPYSSLNKENSEKAGQLPDLSPEYLKADYEKTKQHLQQLALVNVTTLSEQDQINHAVLSHRLQNLVDQYEYNAHHVPLTSEGGFHTWLAFLPRQVNVGSKTELENYLSRLSLFPHYFNQQIGWMNEGLSAGNSQPKVVLNGYESTITSFIVEDPKDSVYYTPFTKLAQHYSPEEAEQLQREAQRIIKNYVVPSYKGFLRYFTKQYYPNARETIGLIHTTNGAEYYQNRAQHYTTTDLTVDEIHDLGLMQVARIRQEMQQIINDLEFDGDFADFLTFLRTDPQFYAKTAEELLMRAAYYSKKMDAQLPKLFRHLPRTPYGVAPVPDHIAPKYTTGRYVSANSDTDAGYYWVNTYALDRRPLYELEALTLHEAVPGHHLQISLTREMDDTPEYRSNYYMSAFGEGWGLYAEKLGKEVGFYQDPYSDFGRLTYEMWRACRLVIDTGIHMKGWSRQRAIDYMKSNSALSEHNVTTEIDRYISWPGQALSYKIGEITISKLRAKAEEALGPKFDIRDFHYEVLKNGSVPLSVLERQIELYIEKTK